MRASDSDLAGSEQSLRGYRIASELRQAILAGTLAPGSRIRQEELAEQFGTSRIPVREALRQLESEGLVTLVPNSGAWVAKLNLQECVEVYRIREKIEPLALNESIPNLSEAAIDLLCKLQEDMENAKGVDDFLKLDREFHLLSYKTSGMPRLYAMVERFWNTTQHYRRAYSTLLGPEGQWIIHYEHRLMMEAIRRRDSDEAGRLLYGHIRRTRLELQKHKEIF